MTIDVPIATQKLCAFCGVVVTKATSSKEDTVPKWLQSELGISTAVVEPTLTAPTGEQVDQRIHPVDQLLTGGICRSCNNGWMSDLEGAAKPILTALMRSERPTTSLVKEERRIVSRWATKTAFMLDLGGLERRVPDHHLRDLFASSPHVPPYLYVFGRQYARTRPWYYAAGAWWKHAPLTADAKQRVTTESYKFLLQFGDLILAVVSWPLQKWGLRIEKDAFVKLWPHTAVVKQYIHPTTQDAGTSEGFCQQHLATISVVPHAGAEGRATSGA